MPQGTLSIAFALLKALAVMFGMAIANWLPEFYISLIVGILFAVFGIHALRAGGADEGEAAVAEKSSHSVFLTTFLLIAACVAYSV